MIFICKKRLGELEEKTKSQKKNWIREYESERADSLHSLENESGLKSKPLISISWKAAEIAWWSCSWRKLFLNSLKSIHYRERLK